MESNEAFEQIKEMNTRLSAVENSVALLSDTDANRAEIVADLTSKGSLAGKVLLVLANGSTQAKIGAAYKARWGVDIGAATIHRALEKLLEFGLITKSPNRRPEFTYSTTKQASRRLMNDLDRATRSGVAGRKK